MDSLTYQLFFSYSRKDNADGNGWVTAFRDRLTAEHQAYTGRDLRGKIFFDKTEIKDMQDWRRRILVGLRQSHLFVAFLSPNFLASKYCRQEWEEYLRREHSVARGDDGIAPVYFVTIPELHSTSLAETARADQAMAAMIDDLKRRNQTRGGNFDLREWFESGPNLLREIDAAERLAELRANPQSDTHHLLPLAERIAALDRHITRRLDRCLLAELAPGNLQRSYAHFVGRHEELRRLHDHLIGGKAGLITALHGLGGLGKTALAVQYAFAYAEFYAAGGRWLLSCEGKTSLAEVLEALALEPALGLAGGERKITAAEVIHALECFTCANAAAILQQLATHPDRESPRGAPLPNETPRCLLIFDNVDDPDLFSADGVATHLKRAEWLEFIVTTRLEAADFGVAVAARGDLVSIAVDSLPVTDALELLRDFQPGKSFADDQDDHDARELAEQLGGYTLAIELAGAYLGAKAWRKPGKLLEQLRQQGLTFADTLAGEKSVQKAVRHKDNVRLILETTLDTLTPAARCVLEHAACLPPDRLVTDWLRAAAAEEHGELDPDADPEPWYGCWDELRGLRLLGPAAGDQTPVPDNPSARARAAVPRLARVHRLVAAHVLAGVPPDRRERRLAGVEAAVNTSATWWAGARRREPAHDWLRLCLGDAALHLAAFHPDHARLAAAALAAGAAELEVGLLSRAQTLIAFGKGVLQAAYQKNPENEEINRLLSDSEVDVGKFYLQRSGQGDAERALGCFERSLQINRRLWERAPDSDHYTSSVSVSESILGDSYLRRGGPEDAERALGCFARSLQINCELLARRPDSIETAHNVSVGGSKLGDLYLQRGGTDNLERALGCFEHSLQAARQLREHNPDSTLAARGVAVCENKLGGSYLRRGKEGDAGRALGCFERSLQTRQELLSRNPDSTEANRDVAVSEFTLGDFYLQRGGSGDAERALGCFERSLQMWHALLSRNPDSTEAARDMSVSCWMCFQAARQAGKDQEGVGYLKTCFSILDQMRRQGCPMDAQMHSIYQQLRPLFASRPADTNEPDPRNR